MHITHAGLDESEAQPNLQLDKCIMNKISNTPDYITHSIIRLLIISIFLSGCTSLKPLETNSKTLHDNIRSGELIEEGDRVRLITKDGSSHVLKVTALSEHVLKGELEGTGSPIEIQIDDIVVVEEERISAGKTTLAVGGGIVAIAAIAFSIFVIHLYYFY